MLLSRICVQIVHAMCVVEVEFFMTQIWVWLRIEYEFEKASNFPFDEVSYIKLVKYAEDE